MAFTATPTDGSTTPIPMSSVVPDGTNTPTALEGGPIISSGGNNLAPVSLYVKDGNDLAQGATTDAAVVSDVNGTLSAKLRGLVKIYADVWDSINHRLHVNVDNTNANGQAAMASSAPVVIASDQTPVAVKVATTTLYTTALVAGATGNSGDLDVSKLHEISIDITTTLVTTNLQFFWERKGADGIYYPLWQTAVLTISANTLSTSIGSGLAYNQSLGLTGRFRWVATGNASFTPNIYGK